MTEQKLVQQSQVFRLHWIIFLRPMMLLAVPILMSRFLGFQAYIFFTFMILAAIWLISEWVHYAFTYLTIQSRNVILQSGFFIQQTIDIPLMKIESIDIKQSLFGTVFNYGDILITGSGGTQQTIQGIHHPLTCRRYIEQCLHAIQE